MSRFLARIRSHKRSLSILAALIVAALGFAALFGLLHSVRPRAIRQAFDALSAPLDSPKPGKLTYSLAYKARR